MTDSGRPPGPDTGEPIPGSNPGSNGAEPNVGGEAPASEAHDPQDPTWHVTTWEGAGWGRGQWQDAAWARVDWQDMGGRRRGRPGRGGPRRVPGFIGCLVLFVVLFLGTLTALATWAAGTLLGAVSPGMAAPAPVALAVILVVLFGMFSGGRTMMRSVRPLAAIANATERLADGEANVRVEVRGPGPVRRLAASFNAMAERLDRAQSARRALLADVTHELRTPLQVIAGSTEAMLDGMHPRDDAHLSPILAETAVMNRLLDDLRTVSLAEAGALPLHREDTDLRRLLADVATGHRASATEAGVAISAAPGPALELSVDPVRIREVMANLVVNAIRHTPRDGTVRLDARIDGPWVELTVEDSGEGIPPADLDRVFDRFQRRADSGGSGLGLTIARDLVIAHGGTIRAESDGIAGHGTILRVRLPRRA